MASPRACHVDAYGPVSTKWNTFHETKIQSAEEGTMSNGNWAERSDAELLAEMRGNSAHSLPYQELSAELGRRVALRQMRAASAQVWSAWLQLATVVIAALAIVVTALKP